MVLEAFQMLCPGCVAHGLPQVQRICPTLYVQSNGRQLAFGATNEVMDDPVVRQAYLGVGA